MATHLGGNAFRVHDADDVLAAYDEWLMNEMEHEDNDDYDLDSNSVPQDGYPLNVGFYRNDRLRDTLLDTCKIEPSDDEIHELWRESGRKYRG